MSAIDLAIFDMDGTVFDSRLDWAQIRDDLQVSKQENILDVIYRGGTVDYDRLEKLEEYEDRNALTAAPIKGISRFLDFLKERHSTKLSLVTNNSKKNCEYLLTKYGLSFDLVVTREINYWKPYPEPLLYVLEKLGCPRARTISIGDSHYDVKAAKAADIDDIYIIKAAKSKINDPSGIVFFEDYFDLQEIIDNKYPPGNGNLLDNREGIL